MNKALLRYEMERRGISIDELVKKVGISRSAFWRKCNGISEFKQSEIQKITNILGLENPMEVFFCDKVS